MSTYNPPTLLQLALDGVLRKDSIDFFSFLSGTEAQALGGYSETNVFGFEMKPGGSQSQLLGEFKQHIIIYQYNVCCIL